MNGGKLTDQNQIHLKAVKDFKKKQADALLKILKPLAKEEPTLRKVYKEIKTLKAELNMVFEWHDGILVESM
jgi:hypothetical protein